MRTEGKKEFRVAFSFDPVRLLFALFFLDVALLVVDVIAFQNIPDEKVRWIVDLNLEANIPTFVSSAELTAVGVVAFLLALSAARVGEAVRKWAWIGIGAFFVLMAVDDATELHERVATLWSVTLHQSEGGGVFHHVFKSFQSYYWQLFFLPFFAAAGLFMILFLRKELGGFRGGALFLAGLAFYVNATILDHFDPFDDVYKGMEPWFGTTWLVIRHYFRDTEEFIELFGTSCILVSFLTHYANLDAQRRLP